METRVLFDLDGTLIKRDFSQISPTSGLARILATGRPMAICSNQGGIAWNLAGGRPGRFYPDWPGVVARIVAGMRLAGVKLAFVALYHPGACIPSGDLLWERGKAIGLPPLLIRLAQDRSNLAAIVSVGDAGLILASWSPAWRKPAAGMLQAALRLLDPGGLFSWIYAGDEEDDRLAAEAAGIGFVKVSEEEQ